MNAIAIIVIACMGGAAHADFTFDDIEYWIGDGANEAAFVVSASRKQYRPAPIRNSCPCLRNALATRTKVPLVLFRSRK